MKLITKNLIMLYLLYLYCALLYEQSCLIMIQVRQKMVMFGILIIIGTFLIFCLPSDHRYKCYFYFIFYHWCVGKFFNDSRTLRFIKEIKMVFIAQSFRVRVQNYLRQFNGGLRGSTFFGLVSNHGLELVYL